MKENSPDLDEHLKLTRRYFLGLGAAGLAGLGASGLAAGESGPEAEMERALARLEYLTPERKFGNVGRGKPPPHKHPEEKLRAVGLTRETWQLEVVPDPETDAKLENPLSRERGNALDWNGLMKLAEKHAVSFLQVITCLNMESPLGTGLWEGVPLREVIWMARPVKNIRRVFYHGYHNDDPKQLFQSSLPVGRVLEDPPGMPPVILCYKLNGQWLTPVRGGPVRMVVPDAYGFKSVKWLNRVVLSNLFHANDTYAGGNNDIDSSLKTFARFIGCPRKAPPNKPLVVTGLAQVGISGLSRVQVWLHPSGSPLPEGDPHFTRGNWKDAEILPPPKQWGGDLPGDLPGGRLPGAPFGFNPATGRPKEWPLWNTIAHWAVALPGAPPGEYDLRCRTIDRAGHAQPMPRPFRKGGRNDIQKVTIRIEE